MNDTERTLHQYVEELTMRLRMRNLPPEQIGQVVAEVEAHVADTGEAPADVFGTPQEYAAQFADRAPRPLRAYLLVGALMVALIVGPYVLTGRAMELSQTRGVDTRSLLVVVGAIVATALWYRFAVVPAQSAQLGRRGRLDRAMVAAVSGLLVLAAIPLAWRLLPAGPVLFTSTGWVLAALLVVPFLLVGWLVRPPQLRAPADPRGPRDR